MPTLFFIIFVLLLPCASGIALAEDALDIGKVKGVFLFGGVQQWLNLAYDFKDSESRNYSNASHSLQESYNASFQMALFDPRIFDASLQGAIIFEQDRNSDVSSKTTSGKNTSYQYTFSGSGLNKSKIPFTLLSFRTTNTVVNTFTAPSTSTNSGNEFGISLLNNKLQSNFHLSRNSSDITTGGTTSSVLSNTYSYGAEHNYGTFSTTSLNAFFSDQSGSTSNSDKLTSTSNSLTLSNSLTFGTRKTYTLLSSFQLNNTMTDKLPQRSLSFSESFGANLGRALSLDSIYMMTINHNTDLAGLSQNETRNHGQIRLKHKLFESLFSEMSGTVDLNKMNDGYENSYAVNGSAKYNKYLTAGSRVSLGVSKGYELVDRQVGSDTATVIDELHSGVHQGNVIQLALASGTLRSVVTVMSRNPLFTYVEGVDFIVSYPLGRITILSGGGVRIDMDGTGTDLYITYKVYKDPQLKYASNSFSATSELSILDGKLVTGASWAQTSRTVISGPAVNSLQDSNSMMLFVAGNYDTVTTQVSYRNEATGSLTVKTFEGNLATSWQTDKSIISFSARNGYSITDDSSTAVSYRESNADIAVTYVRGIMSNGNLRLLAHINDQRSEISPTKDSLSIQAVCVIWLNLVTINLSGQTTWLFIAGETTRNDSVHIDLTRYF